MKNYQFLDKTAEFSVFTGEVLDQNTQVEPHISSRGGTPYRPLEIDSETVITKELWMRLDDGSEEFFELDAGLPIRVGHRITLIFTGLVGAKKMFPTVGINHTTGQRKRFMSARELNGETFQFGMSGKTILLSLAIMAAGVPLLNKLGYDHFLLIPILCVLPLIAYRWRAMYRRLMSLENGLNDHIEKGVDQIIQQHSLN